MKATEFKNILERVTNRTVRVEVLPNKEVLICPAINWPRTPEYLQELWHEFRTTPIEER